MSRKRSRSGPSTPTFEDQDRGRDAGLTDLFGRDRPLKHKRLCLDTRVSDMRTQLDEIIDVDPSPTEVSSPFPSEYAYSSRFLNGLSTDTRDGPLSFSSPLSYSTPLRRRPLTASTSAERPNRHFLEYGTSNECECHILNEVSPSPAPRIQPSTPPPGAHTPPSYSLHRLVRSMSLNPLPQHDPRYTTPSPSPAPRRSTLRTPLRTNHIRLLTPGAPARPSRQWQSEAAGDTLLSSPVSLHECLDRPSHRSLSLYERLDRPPTPGQPDVFQYGVFSADATDRINGEDQDGADDELNEPDPSACSTRSPTALSIISGKSTPSLPASAMKKSKTTRKLKNVRMAMPARRRSESVKVTNRYHAAEDTLNRHRRQVLQARAKND